MSVKTTLFDSAGNEIKLTADYTLRSHPAKYSNKLLPIFAEYLKDKKNVLDVFAGTCKISKIKDYGFEGKIVCNELEYEWALHGLGKVDEIYLCDAKKMVWARDGEFEAVTTSPVYGNRMSDNYIAKDNSKRYTYRQLLGRKPTHTSSATLQWGYSYKKFHISAWKEVYRVLEPGGIFILNCSNHVRKGVEQLVTEWHMEAICNIGFSLEDWIEVETRRMGFGANRNLRALSESILIFKKEE
jgi:hypothetical protein